MDRGVYIGIGVSAAFVMLQYLVKQMPTPIAAAGFFAGLAIIAWGVIPVGMKPSIGPFLLYSIALCAFVAGVAWQVETPKAALAAQPQASAPTPPDAPVAAPGDVPHVTPKHSTHHDGPAAAPPPVQNNYGGIITNNQSGGSNTIINPPPNRDPNGFYQGGTKVGRGQGGELNADGTSVTFQAGSFSEFPETGKPLEYRGMLLECDNLPVARPNVFVGQLSAMIVGMTCRVIGKA